MAVNYDSHPAELVDPGKIQNESTQISIKDLRNAIPSHCFKPSPTRSLLWLLHDIFFVTILPVGAYYLIRQIKSSVLRCSAWALYGWAEGLIFTGLWVLGHECGHGAFLPWKVANDSTGFILHAFLMTPYFSWKSTHRKHHIYANNMKLDLHYVPPRRAEYLQAFGSHVRGLEDLTEDAPITTLLRILLQQLVGWPWYLIYNVTASPKSLATSTESAAWFGNSHLVPWGSLFSAGEAHLIILSDLGLCAMATLLYLCSLRIGSTMTMLLYLQPYLWVNHWLIAITYLHHTHPKLPKFEPESWTFLKGATATIDRRFGFIGRHFFHNIIDCHVIHHLFSRIPFYHAQEATEAVMPLMGNQYHSSDGKFLYGLWESFTQCQFVEPDMKEKVEERALWYRAGPLPPPEINMGRRAWFPRLW